MQTPKLDPTKLTPEQRDKLEDYNLKKDTLQALNDMADMLQEAVGLLDKNDATDKLDKMGALLVDMRGALRSLDAKEAPEQLDMAEPVVDAISKLEKALTAAVKAQKAPVVNVPKQDAPSIQVAAPVVDTTKIEKLLKADLPQALDKAIQSIVIPKTDNKDLAKLLKDVSEKLTSIDTAVRMKPQAPTTVTTLEGTGLVPEVYDAITYTDTSTTVDTYRYYQGGTGGTLIATLTVTYSDPTTKSILVSAVRT